MMEKIDKEKIISNTVRLINYFRALANSEESNSFEWHLGLFMAKQLLPLA